MTAPCSPQRGVVLSRKTDVPDDAHEMAACAAEKWALCTPAGTEDYPVQLLLQAEGASALQPGPAHAAQGLSAGMMP